MPAPIDPSVMVGKRYGKLVIVRMCERKPYGGKLLPTYLCQCDCGNEQVCHHIELHHPKESSRWRSCAECRERRECVICGKVWQSKQYKNQCSAECRKEYRRQAALASYYKRVAADPEFNQRNYQRKKERMAENPELALNVRLREQQRTNRRGEAGQTKGPRTGLCRRQCGGGALESPASEAQITGFTVQV